jgi:hypothetical protein
MRRIFRLDVSRFHPAAVNHSKNGTVQEWPILGNTGISARIVIGPAFERVHATLLVAALMPHHPTHQID